MIAIYLLLAALLWLAGRIVLVWWRPERSCRWCGGRGSRKTLILGRKRRCWRCNGSRYTGRYGARLVREAHLAIRRAWVEWRYRR